MLRHRQAIVQLSQYRAFGHPHVRIADFWVIGRHVECPKIFADFKSRCIAWHHKTGDAARFAVIAIGPGKGHDMAGIGQPGGPHLVTINQITRHAITNFRNGAGIHMRCIAAMMLLGQAKAPAHFPFEHQRYEITLLLLRAKIAQHQYLHQIADYAAFILQIIVQTQPLVRQMVTDHRHGEIGAIFPAKFRGNGIAIMPCLVGDASHFCKQCPPIGARMPVIIPIGARMFAAVVKETDIVVALLNRFDFAFDKAIKLCEIVGDISRDFKQCHGGCSPAPALHHQRGRAGRSRVQAT